MSAIWQPKVWVAVLLGVIVQPFAFLYLNKLALFWLYLILVSIANLLDWRYQMHLGIIFMVVCPIHAYLVAKNNDAKTKRNWYSKWWGIPAIHAVIFSVVFLIRSFFYEPFSVPAASMSPSLEVGDVFIVKKLGFGGYGTYGLKLIDASLSDSIDLERGKMYAFYPPNLDVPFVKRLIGKPGDRVNIKGNKVFVNDSLLKTSFVSEDQDFNFYNEVSDAQLYPIKTTEAGSPVENLVITVPEDNYFFLGDNRDNSADSRYWGTVPSTDFIGEVVYVFGK